MRSRAADGVRVVWLAALCVLTAGSYHVEMHFQRAIAASHARTETLYRQTVANTRIVREAASLRHIQNRAEADLARISRDASLSKNTANLLTMLHVSATRFNTRVLQVQPEASEPSSTGAPLQSTAITIRVRGTFRDILRFIEDLSHHATLINVADTEMALAPRTSDTGVEPRLDATVHAVMYRLTVPPAGKLRVAPN